MQQIVIGILFSIGMSCLAAAVVSIIILWHEIKYYRAIYITLPLKNYYLNTTFENPMDYVGKTVPIKELQVYDDNEYDVNNFVWFPDNNHFKLGKDLYLHNNFVTWSNPYSLYWLIKYKNWFKKNIDINTLKIYDGTGRQKYYRKSQKNS